MGIQISGYDVVCEGCDTPLVYCVPRAEAEEIVATQRNCIVVDGRVYCCDECREKGEAAR